MERKNYEKSEYSHDDTLISSTDVLDDTINQNSSENSIEITVPSTFKDSEDKLASEEASSSKDENYIIDPKLPSESVKTLELNADENKILLQHQETVVNDSLLKTSIAVEEFQVDQASQVVNVELKDQKMDETILNVHLRKPSEEERTPTPKLEKILTLLRLRSEIMKKSGRK